MQEGFRWHHYHSVEEILDRGGIYTYLRFRAPIILIFDCRDVTFFRAIGDSECRRCNCEDSQETRMECVDEFHIHHYSPIRGSEGDTQDTSFSLRSISDGGHYTQRSEARLGAGKPARNTVRRFPRFEAIWTSAFLHTSLRLL